LIPASYLSLSGAILMLGLGIDAALKCKEYKEREDE